MIYFFQHKTLASIRTYLRAESREAAQQIVGSDYTFTHAL